MLRVKNSLAIVTAFPSAVRAVPGVAVKPWVLDNRHVHTIEALRSQRCAAPSPLSRKQAAEGTATALGMRECVGFNASCAASCQGSGLSLWHNHHELSLPSLRLLVVYALTHNATE